MTALFRCDGCEGIMSDDSPRIAIEIVNEPPVEQLSDDGEMFTSIQIQGLGFVGTHHFCQMSCLSAWALGRALTDQDATGA